MLGGMPSQQVLTIRRVNYLAGIEDNTASVRCGFEAGSKPAVADSIGDCGHDHKVHAADELGVFLGQRVEGAVGQQNRAVGPLWCVAVAGQRLTGGGDEPFATWSRTGGCSGLVSDSAAPVGGGCGQGVGDGSAVRCGIVDGASQ